ncbi:hypothetical protein GCM10017764_18510 [Sphingobacterium griseoflavum]|uniref:Uncharacterized protein n=1 Tax=Sphingobacterium griseoflavum TaxID=1474952 RepID=A0ABQ3HZR3_9SPHI|nr:hypothetical protein GCM10017764_18510 [Sphingobacterium griseoflavum]
MYFFENPFKPCPKIGLSIIMSTEHFQTNNLPNPEFMLMKKRDPKRINDAMKIFLKGINLL